MKKITLRQLNIFDLSVGYARLMGGNKIKHYRVSVGHSLAEKESQKTPLDLIKEKITQEEGEVELEVLPSTMGNLVGHLGGSALPVLNINDEILKDDPEIKKSLETFKSSSILHQYNICPNPIKTKYLRPITKFINENIITKLNRVLYRLAGPVDWSLDNTLNIIENKNNFRRAMEKIPKIKHLPEWGHVRCVTACHFLTVVFDSDDLKEATQALLNDLKILQSHNLIMGHLSMPSMIMLADSTGSGKNTYAAFCFLFVDDQKMRKILNKGPLEMPRKPLELLGVKHECFEGEIKYLNNVNPDSKYDIETVNIEPKVDVQKELIENYKETRKFVDNFDAIEMSRIKKMKE